MSTQQATDAADLPASLPVPATEVLTRAELEEDLSTIQRIENLPAEAGWLLVWVGLLGLIVPGIIGLPFLVAGSAVITPGGRKRLARWVGRRPPKFVHGSLRQMGRMLDDLERRYPRLERAPRSGAAGGAPRS